MSFSLLLTKVGNSFIDTEYETWNIDLMILENNLKHILIVKILTVLAKDWEEEKMYDFWKRPAFCRYRKI